jgi:hypothetical protein
MKTSTVIGLLALFTAPPADATAPYVPNVPELTIRIRVTGNAAAGGPTSSRTLLFKGARQRVEDTDGHLSHFAHVTQCDEQRTFWLNRRARTYANQQLPDMSYVFKRAELSVATPPDHSAAGVDTITTNSIDTGERRPFGPYLGRHVITNRRTDYRSSGTIHLEERDGWYIDLPVGCIDWAASIEQSDTTPLSPHIRLVLRGNGRRGYPLIETILTSTGTTVGEDGRPGPVTTASKTELIEISQQTVDPALFDLPAGYRPALATLDGGIDMGRQDTLSNRAELYWQHLVMRVKQLLPGCVPWLQPACNYSAQ